MGILSLLRPLYTGWTWPVIFLGVLIAFLWLPTADKEEFCSLHPHTSFILCSDRVVTPHGVFPASIEVRGGRIAAVTQMEACRPGGADELPVVDRTGAVISPGLVDLHVHLNEPGRDDWEGFITGTQAAAAGGVTALVDMPLNCNPTTTSRHLLDLKLKAAHGKIMVDTAFWGGLVPENAFNKTALEDLFAGGVVGLKAFMCPSGINDFPATNVSHFEAALPVVAKHEGILMVHAEVELPPGPGQAPAGGGDKRNYATYSSSRPPTWEREAIRQVAALARGTAPSGQYEGARIHIAHLSDAESLATIAEAQAAGAALTVETCPHYLAFAEDDVADGRTELKCAPPLRGAANRDALWAAVLDGRIGMVASDHSPSPPALKLLEEGDFMRAWGGISGLQFDLMATWTFGRERGLTLRHLAEIWSSRPAALARWKQKGAIEEGKDADFVVWDPDAEFQIDANFTLYHKHKVTPYRDLRMSGRVLETYVRGNLVYAAGAGHARVACGAPLLARATPLAAAISSLLPEL